MPRYVRLTGRCQPVTGPGTYGLGAIGARKKQISAIAVVDVLLLSHDAKVNKRMWAWHAVQRCVSK